MIVEIHNNQFECFFSALLVKCSSKQKLNRNMAEVLYSMSKPRRSDVTGAANQVYELDDFVAFMIKTIRANNVSAISSVDTNGLHQTSMRIFKVNRPRSWATLAMSKENSAWSRSRSRI